MSFPPALPSRQAKAGIQTWIPNQVGNDIGRKRSDTERVGNDIKKVRNDKRAVEIFINMSVYKIFLKDVFLDVVWEVLYFPLWWYSRGLKNTGFFCLRRLKNAWRFLALSIILRSFFKPMFAQRGWDAYVLTLMVRCWQIFWRFIFIFICAVFWACIFLAWIALPLFIIWQLFL